MIRLIQAAAVLMTLASPVFAQPADISVQYKTSSLATVEGRADIKHRVDAEIARVCQANDYGRMDACSAKVARQVNAQIDARAEQYAKSNTVQLARR